MHNIVSFKYISESSAYLYRLTTQVSSWTEDIELRDNNHLYLLLCIVRQSWHVFFKVMWVMSRGIKSQGIVYFGV